MDVYVEDRPWGKFEKYIENEKCTVKILYLKPNSKLSLQYHSKRDEWWKVINGSIKIHVNDDEFSLTENDSFFIKKGSKHRMINLEYPSIVLEISTGDFDEGDIVRLEDIYDRV
ncbi:MAG: phosphomannose isomerase type II C-terminal cupin domain [Nitrosopumilus sp.]|nr:phosphomannose isomerase type II C-terminal cupin domain [Nitrosopumilus sp.]